MKTITAEPEYKMYQCPTCGQPDPRYKIRIIRLNSAHQHAWEQMESRRKALNLGWPYWLTFALSLLATLGVFSGFGFSISQGELLFHGKRAALALIPLAILVATFFVAFKHDKKIGNIEDEKKEFLAAHYGLGKEGYEIAQ